MGKARACTALIVVALLGLSIFAASASALPGRYWGVVPQSLLSEEQFQRLQQGGAKSMRIPIDWAGVQPEGRNAPMVWDGLDVLIERAVKANIEVLPFLSGAPNWAVPSAYVPGDRRTKAPAHLPASGAAAGAWTKFVKAAVGRYGPGGDFWAQRPDLPQRPIHSWQVWNEENFKYFVARPNPAEYGRLVKRTHAALHAVDPSARVVLGGLFAYPKGCKHKRPKNLCGTNFLQQMYKRTPGVRTKFDAVALHPYTDRFQQLSFEIEEFRRVLAKNRDARKPLWITELGWSSQPPDRAGNVFAKGPGGQARQLKGAFTLLRNKQAKWRLQRVYWFSVDDAEGTCNFCDGSGLFGEGFKPKKSWYTFVRFAGGRP